jgi:hypothetical protein
MRDTRKLAGLLAIPALIAATAVPALALLYPLSTTAVRDAYFIGNKNNQQTQDFLAQYKHDFPKPETGPYVHDISISTPFTQVVRLSQTDANMRAPDAVEQFAHQPFAVHVEVTIFTTDTYAPQTELSTQLRQWVPDFWNDFKVQVFQNQGAVAPKRVRGGPLFMYWGGEGTAPMIVGAKLDLEYDAAELESAPARVEVVTPDGQKISTNFDLGTLQ